MKSVVLAAVLLAGCAATPASAPRTPDPDSFRFVGGGSSTTARFVEPGVLQSSLGLVQAFPDGFRGRWLEETVDLRAHDGMVDGFIGGLRTELHVEPRPGGFVLRGIYREHLGELHVDPERIEGTVGLGTISVERISDEAYSGFMPERTGADRRQRALSVPVAFSSLPQEQQALYLALLIGR